MNKPNFGYAHDSSQGGEGGHLHTLEEYLRSQIRSEMDEAGVPANQPYDEVKFDELVRRIQDDLDGIVDLENDHSRDTYVKIYTLGYDLENLRLP